MVRSGSQGAIRVEGQVLDGNGEPVPDAMLEVWAPSVGFGRCRTDPEGAFHFVVAKPGSSSDGAPHLNVTVFARGLLRHLVTRMYFPGEPKNDDDPVLKRVEPARRSTLIAVEDRGVLHFDIRLQGENETVFFAI